MNFTVYTNRCWRTCWSLPLTQQNLWLRSLLNFAVGLFLIMYFATTKWYLVACSQLLTCYISLLLHKLRHLVRGDGEKNRLESDLPSSLLILLWKQSRSIHSRAGLCSNAQRFHQLKVLWCSELYKVLDNQYSESLPKKTAENKYHYSHCSEGKWSLREIK